MDTTALKKMQTAEDIKFLSSIPKDENTMQTTQQIAQHHAQKAENEINQTSWQQALNPKTPYPTRQQITQKHITNALNQQTTQNQTTNQ